MPNVPHLHDPKLHGKPERVIFNFEIGYKYKPVTETSTIDEVFEYSFICRKLLDLQDDIHSCISEYLLENICNDIMIDDRVLYVKASLERLDVITNGSLMTGIEKYNNEYYKRFKY